MGSRRRLRKLRDKRVTLRGRFVRWGADYAGNRTVLLRDVTNCNGEFLCDHVWMHCSQKRHSLEGVVKGDQLQFRATVRKYHKGLALAGLKRIERIETDDATNDSRV